MNFKDIFGKKLEGLKNKLNTCEIEHENLRNAILDLENKKPIDLLIDQLKDHIKTIRNLAYAAGSNKYYAYRFLWDNHDKQQDLLVKEEETINKLLNEILKLNKEVVK